MKLGLDNIRTLLAALGDPQNKYFKVQVAGTNGKGSVCAFLSAICLAAGVKTGLYTSPHLISMTERVSVNGVDITEDEFARFAGLVRDTAESLLADGALEYRPTFFEQMTAIALVAFAEAGVELAILETGLGGRLDATTAANAEIAAITRIDLDHQEYLGDTIAEIASEKAAIIDGAVDVVLGRQSPEVMKILLERCAANHVEPITGDGELDWKLTKGGDRGTVKLDTNIYSFPECALGLKGQHQIENAQIAVSISQTLHYGCIDLPDEAVYLGIQHAVHPGRLEYVGRFLFDGAHNVAGARALREYLEQCVAQPITMIFAAMKDKQIREIADLLFPKADTLIFTKPENARALDPNDMLIYVPTGFDLGKVFVTHDVADAIAKATEVTDDDGLILVTGSLYLVGEAKKIVDN